MWKVRVNFTYAKKMIILFLCKKGFASCSRYVSLNPQWPLSLTDGKREEHPENILASGGGHEV